MLRLSELTNKIWNEKDIPNDIKIEWAAICNDRSNMLPLPEQTWLKIDIIYKKGVRYSELAIRLQNLPYLWINDAITYLEYWKKELLAMI